MRTEG